MNIQLLMVGAGEFRSFREDTPTSYFLRFLAVNGDTLDLPVSEEQLGTVLTFAATGAAPPSEEPAPVHEDDEPPLRTPPPLREVRHPSAEEPLVGFPPVVRAKPPLVFGNADDDERDL